ncbi:MAG: hypothetical protein FJ385_01975, partial [Verrucomicrobia bacterium]|nr:hypothetical protein [Verrucomicrobiota bacterium]
MTTTNLLRRIASTRSALLAIACVTLAPLHAQIAVRAVSTTNKSKGSPSTIVIDKPSGVVEGDVMLASITMNSQNLGDIAPPTGWTTISEENLNPTATNNKTRGGVFYKVAGASEGVSYTFNLSANITNNDSNGASGAIVAFSGVESSPIDAQGTILVGAAGSQSVSANAITTNSPNAAVVMFGMVGGASQTWSNWSTTSPGSLTEIAEITRGGSSVGVAWASKSSAGSTGSGSVTKLLTLQQVGAVLVSLKSKIPFSASSLAIDTGGSSTLTWDATGASSVSIDNGVGSVAASGSTTVSPATTTTYTLTAEFGGITKTSIVTVTVMEPGPYRYYRFVPVTLRGGKNMVQLVEFQMVLDGVRVAATTTSNPGGSNQPADGEGSNKANDNDLNTKWLDGNKKPLVYDFGTTQNVTAYRWATGNDSDDRDPISWTVDGSHDGVNWKTLDTQTNYSVPTTRKAYMADFALPPFAGPAVNTFAVADPVIVIGSSTTLTWNVSNADSISINNSIGSVSATGSATLSPQATTSYTLTAIGEGITRTRTITLTVVNGGLLGKTFDTLAGSSNLDPITGLTSATPSGTFVETGAISYPNGTLTALPGITNDSDFSVLWTGWFDVTIGGTGDYTFGVGSDDGSVIYLDINADGDFADVGEKIVSSGGGGGASSGATGTVNLSMNFVK